MVVNHNQSRFASQPTEIACASLANQQRGNGRTIAAKLSTIATISSGLVYPMDRPRPCQDEDAGHSLGRVPCSISTHWACVMLDLNSLGVCHARSELSSSPSPSPRPTPVSISLSYLLLPYTYFKYPQKYDWSRGFRGANQNTECLHDSQWERCIFLS